MTSLMIYSQFSFLKTWAGCAFRQYCIWGNSNMCKLKLHIHHHVRNTTYRYRSV